MIIFLALCILLRLETRSYWMQVVRPGTSVMRWELMGKIWSNGDESILDQITSKFNALGKITVPQSKG